MQQLKHIEYENFPSSNEQEAVNVCKHHDNSIIPVKASQKEDDTISLSNCEPSTFFE
jgi:hypothetical protein